MRIRNRIRVRGCLSGRAHRNHGTLPGGAVVLGVCMVLGRNCTFRILPRVGRISAGNGGRSSWSFSYS